MSIPIVSLDKIYITPDEENIFFLDCTRVSGSNKIISRKKESLNSQINRLSVLLKGKKIILSDDVVFSGSVLRTIIQKFKEQNVEVIGIISSISTKEAFDYFNEVLPLGLKTNYLMNNGVIDQICERDFYFGIAGSGIMIDTKDGLYKSPYFKPYGDPITRASIPEDYEYFFSQSCIERSIYLWEEIDRLKKIKTKILELPEKIINTKENDSVVMTLKKEMK